MRSKSIENHFSKNLSIDKNLRVDDHNCRGISLKKMYNTNNSTLMQGHNSSTSPFCLEKQDNLSSKEEIFSKRNHSALDHVDNLR